MTVLRTCRSPAVGLWLLVVVLLCAAALWAPAQAWAQTAPVPAPAAVVVAVAAAAPAAPRLDAGDTAWMLTSTLLVTLMVIPGLALFYGGLARSKNMLSVLVQVFVVFALISVL